MVWLALECDFKMYQSVFLQRHFLYLYMSFVCAVCRYTVEHCIVRMLVTHGRPLCVTADGRIALDLRTVAAFVWTDFIFSILQIPFCRLYFAFCILSFGADGRIASPDLHLLTDCISFCLNRTSLLAMYVVQR